MQAGHGRSGEGLWSFPAWGVTPDIVTLGKPMGNGHPMAAVITRAELADRLAAETEFFSTFGGNPVACVAALAVLDVIEDEGLVGNAAASRRGAAHAAARAGAAPSRHRGRPGPRPDGRAWSWRGTGRPATRVKDEMRERGVLIGTTRREGNVAEDPPAAVP